MTIRFASIQLKNIRTAAAFLLAFVSLTSSADHTPEPASVAVAGSLQSELGCPGDWQPDCANTHLTFDADDTVWQGIFEVPAGNWEYKGALNDSWAENYGTNSQQDGPNIPLSLAAGTSVKFYYDHHTHWITDNVNARIVTAVGSFQDELGCPGDWQPDCLRSWLQDPDGDGLYTFETDKIPPGSYEAKVAVNESWAENYGDGGIVGGVNIPVTVGADATAFFSFDSASNVLTITVPQIDADGDGVPDEQDICPGGDDNLDTDGDLTPDDCDACPIDPENDADGDGVCGDLDVCSGGDDTIDTDNDGTPDVCDACPIDPENDVDGDGVCGEVDVCPVVADNQDDTDGDGIGDACDFDSDNDGVCDAGAAVEGLCTAGPDNCPLHENPSQSDIDGDGAGDACDTDVDGDNVVDYFDACPMTVTGEIVNADGCSVPDLCSCDNEWKNHGGYVRCMAYTSEGFVAAGLITEAEKDAIVSTAGMSSCGAKK